MNRSRGETIFSFRPSRSSIGFQVVYCSGNSPFAAMTSSPGFHVTAYATAATPALAPLVSATSSGFPPISFAIEARMRLGPSKNVESGFGCGYFFASSAACTARMETFGIGDWPAKFKYVASSISNHSFRQSVCREVVVAAMGFSFAGVTRNQIRAYCAGYNVQFGQCVRPRSSLEMTAKLAEGRQDHQLSGTRHHRFVLQVPGVLVRDVHGIEADLHRRIDVAARAVADHPTVGLHNLVFVDQSAIGLGIFLRNDFDEFEHSLQAGPLHPAVLFRRLSLGKKNEPVPLGEIRKRLWHAVQNFRGCPLQVDDAAMN